MIPDCYYLVRGQRVYSGPFVTRGEAENAWRCLSPSMLAVAIYRDGKLIEVG